MSDVTGQTPDTALQALSEIVSNASDPAIMRIVSMVDAMTKRGSADQLIAPLRPHLRALRPPRPLRFKRLVFTPLDPLIVPGVRWRSGQDTIPRAMVAPIADCVHTVMGAEADAIEAEIAGKTTADTDLIARLGRTLWPKAAHIIARTKMPESWASSKLGDAAYQSLASIIAALLAQAAPLDTVCAETADGLLPPRPEVIAKMLGKTMAANPVALPMLITLMLSRLPQTVALILPKYLGPEAAAIYAALDQAADKLLRQFDENQAAEERFAAVPLSEAGFTVRRIVTLLDQLRAGIVSPQRREQIQSIRQRLDVSCQARFIAGLQDGLLAPMQQPGTPLGPAIVSSMEAAARGLRVLEIEARALKSGSVYDLMLRKAVEAITADTMRDKLTPVNQMRLVEILRGPDAGLAMFAKFR